MNKFIKGSLWLLVMLYVVVHVSLSCPTAGYWKTYQPLKGGNLLFTILESIMNRFKFSVIKSIIEYYRQQFHRSCQDEAVFTFTGSYSIQVRQSGYHSLGCGKNTLI